jgi:hypothetical protein
MNLTEILDDIARTNIREAGDRAISPKPALYRHNHWQTVTDGDYGQFYDFEVSTHPDGRSVLTGASEAALKWIWTYLPDELDSYGTGYVISTNIELIIAHMEKDGLVDRRQAETNEQEYAG